MKRLFGNVKDDNWMFHCSQLWWKNSKIRFWLLASKWNSVIMRCRSSRALTIELFRDPTVKCSVRSLPLLYRGHSFSFVKVFHSVTEDSEVLALSSAVSFKFGIKVLNLYFIVCLFNLICFLFIYCMLIFNVGPNCVFPWIRVIAKFSTTLLF